MWHSYLTWYMSLPYIIKLSHTVWKLWAAQDFSFRGHKNIMNKVRVVSLACDMLIHAYRSLSMPVPNIIKIYQIIEKLWSAQEFGWEICSGEIIKKKNKARFVLLVCDTPTWLDISPYQILSNYLKQYEIYSLHKISFSGEITTKKKVIVDLLHTTPHLVLIYASTKYYQNILNY